MNSIYKINVPELKNYPGCKGGNGVYQQIISHIPPHRILVLPFLGHCGILRNIAPADIVIAVDASYKVVSSWRNYLTEILKYDIDSNNSVFYKNLYSPGALPETIHIYQDDALHFLIHSLPGILHTYRDTAENVFCYLDPPYPFSTRKSQRKIYEKEMSDQEHLQLLSSIKEMMANTMISTYKNRMYDQSLSEWNTHSFRVSTRNGPATESIYFNYSLQDGMLHDYRFLGKNFKDRERIRNKINRWVNKLNTLDPSERMAIVHQINTHVNK